MEDGDTESENASRVIQDFVFLCRKIDILTHLAYRANAKQV